ncbi:Histidine kinase [Pelomyxa schiedti]|nr:Histidine kinase [Pelomyxa schiedti]
MAKREEEEQTCGYGYDDHYGGTSTTTGAHNSTDLLGDQYDWNTEYTGIRRRHLDDRSTSPEAKERQSNELIALEERFVARALETAVLLVEQQFLPENLRTIRRVSVGGVAGGDKYIVGGIFFKFAVDTCGIYRRNTPASTSTPEAQPPPTTVQSTPNSASNTLPSDYDPTAAPNKVAGHEGKGLQALANAALATGLFPILGWPLMIIVDYLGHRVVASTILPIGHDTLVVGSSDGGHTNLCIGGKTQLAVELIGKWLYLKRHTITNGKTQTKLYTPFDFEAHQKGSEIYCVDFARLAPPYDKSNPLTHLFRFEFLKAYRVPLCCDTFINGLLPPSEKLECEMETKAARECLLNSRIPMLTNNLDQLWNEQPDIPAPFLIFFVHSFGVNLHFLPLIWDLSHNSQLRNLLLTEIVARALRKCIYASIHLGENPKDAVTSTMEGLLSGTEGVWATIFSKVKSIFMMPVVSSTASSVLPSGPESFFDVLSSSREHIAAPSMRRALFLLNTKPIQPKDSPALCLAFCGEVHPGNPPNWDSIELCPRVQQLFLLSFQQAANYKLAADKLLKGKKRFDLLLQAAEKYMECICLNTQNRFALHNFSRILRILYSSGDCTELGLSRNATLLMARELSSLSGLTHNVDLYRWRDLIPLHALPSHTTTDPHTQPVFHFTDERPSFVDMNAGPLFFL